LCWLTFKRIENRSNFLMSKDVINEAEMKILNRRQLLHLGTVALAAMPEFARAQAYPSRTITIVDTFPPGGSTGIIARIVADKLSAALGGTIVVDHRGGAGGTVAAAQIAKSEPDGYTLMLGFTGTLAIAPSLYAKPGYDPRRDFAPVGSIGFAPSSIVVHPSFPAHSIADLIAYAKAKPGEVNFGSAGIGSVGHVAGELFAKTAGIKLTHVPYRGTGPALADLLGGHIQMAISPIPATAEQARNGKLRMLAVTSLQRSSIMPDVPTVAEQGLPGYEAVLRYGIVALAGTPRSIIERLNTNMRAVLSDGEVRMRLAGEGAEILASSPEDYAAAIEAELTKWSALVQSLGLKAE
jgi:tripartite-type tricarboxylate transporter receptor subunit TctC